MQKKSNIVSKLVLSTAAALMGAGAIAEATEQPDIQESAQLANFLAEIGDEVEGKGTIADIGVTYKVTADDTEKTAEVIDCDNSKVSKNVQIADKIDNDKNVTAIAAEAFKDCTKIESIEVPASVKTIGKNAFDGCSNLKVISMAGDVSDLTEGFLGSASPESFYVTSSAMQKELTGEHDIAADKIHTPVNETAVGINELNHEMANTGVKLTWTYSADANVDCCLVLRRDKSESIDKNTAIAKVSTSEFEYPTEYVDTTAEFGKSYTYTVLPVIMSDRFEDMTAEELYAESKYDSFGINTTDEKAAKTVEVLINEATIYGIRHYYSKNGEVFTPVTSTSLTSVQGDDSKTWYVMDNSGKVYNKSEKPTAIDNAYNNAVGLTVREWDLTEKTDKQAWEQIELDGITKEELMGKSYKVFTLNVLDSNGDPASATLKTDSFTNAAENYAVYFELSPNMDKNSVSVLVPDDIGGRDFVYSAANGNLEYVTEIKGHGNAAPKSDYGFVKIMMNSDFPDQPFVMYADKIENSSSSSDSTDKKEENNSEDKKEENKNNSSNGSTSGSKGYATGDVAGFGMLHAAYSMLAAAGSTLLGLFRKKK